MSTYVFDAYGTLFDVHAAIARHRGAAGPEADRCSEIWRTKQLEYTWTLTLAGHYVDFWTLTERALDYALARVPTVDSSLRPQLLDAYLKLDAFADARGALAALKARSARLKPARPRGLHSGQWRALKAGLQFDRERRPTDTQAWLAQLDLRAAAPHLPALARLSGLQPSRDYNIGLWMKYAAVTAIIALCGWWTNQYYDAVVGGGAGAAIPPDDHPPHPPGPDTAKGAEG